MKKLLITASLIVATASPALAQKQAVATITSVEPNYRTVTYNVPKTECEVIEVPIYGNGSKELDTEGAIVGGIIGGIIGNQVGKGSGKEAATGVGALAGAIIGGQKNKSNQVVGYRREQQCKEVMVRTTEKELKNYTIWYEWNGAVGKSFTYNNYSVGDRIPVNVTINAK